MEDINLSPAVVRSESPSQGAERPGLSEQSTPSAASERSEEGFTVSAPDDDAPVDGDGDRASAGREMPAAVVREDEPEHKPSKERVRLVKLYVRESTAEEVERAISASGLSRASFVSCAFVCGARSLASLLSVRME